jgi:transcriptional regulator with XRE-family HTH domain
MSITTIQAQRLGALIATARTRKGLSVKGIANQLGVSHGWFSELEHGRFVDPSPDRLARIAEALDIEPGKIDRITKGSVAQSLPGMQTYFRAKYDLTPEQIERVERYVRRIQRGPS